MSSFPHFPFISIKQNLLLSFNSQNQSIVSASSPLVLQTQHILHHKEEQKKSPKHNNNEVLHLSRVPGPVLRHRVSPLPLPLFPSALSIPSFKTSHINFCPPPFTQSILPTLLVSKKQGASRSQLQMPRPIRHGSPIRRHYKVLLRQRRVDYVSARAA